MERKPPTRALRVTREVKLSKKKSIKERSHLKLIRKDDNIDELDDSEREEWGTMKVALLKERLSWRGVEAKAVMLSLASLSILVAVIVLFGLSAALSMVN